MRRILFGLIFVFGVAEVFSQATATFDTFINDYSLIDGTWSFRQNDFGSVTGFHNRTGWNSTPYTEGYLAYYGNFRMNFRFLYPVGYDENYEPGYPMIVMLHGAGERGNCWGNNCYYSNANWIPWNNGSSPPNGYAPNSSINLMNNDHNLVHGGYPHMEAVNRAGSKLPNDPTLDDRDFPGFILFPQNTNGWVANPGKQTDDAIRIIYKLLEDPDVNIDPNRIYVHGLSNGGQGTTYSLPQDPGLFASAAMMSPTVEPIRFTDTSIAHIPIWLFQGGKDMNPSPSETLEMQKFFGEAGGNARYTLYPTLGHGTWNAAYSEPDFFSWMLDKSKANAHVYYLDSALCSTNSNGIDIGFTSGWPAYQWEQDGEIIITDNTTNTLTVFQPGVYRGRFSRVEASPTESDWNTWSEPIIITESIAPIVEVKQHTSVHLPDKTGATNAILTGPKLQNTKYKWFINDVEYTNVLGFGYDPNTVIDTIRYINTTYTGTGVYTLITETYGGCTAEVSEPVYVNMNSPENLTAPSNVQAISNAPGSIQLFWQDNSASETGVEIYRSTDEINWEFVKLVGEDDISFTDTGLPNGTLFYYSLRSVNNTEISPYTSNVSTTAGVDTIAPSAPTSLISSGGDIDHINLSWTAATDNTGILQYYVYFGSDSVATGSNVTSFSVTGLLPDFTFSFYVKAVDLAGNFSPPSNQIQASTIFNGLNYEHSTGAWQDLDEDTNFGPNHYVEFTGHVDEFTIASTTQADFFNFRFTGYLYIDNPGDYDFILQSDDGSRLYIDGNVALDYDGLHGCSQKSTSNNGGPINLSVGRHTIEVIYFEYTGGECLTVFYRGPDTGNNYVGIPTSALRSGNEPVLTPPLAPTSLTAQSSGMSSIDLDWAFAGSPPQDLSVVVLGSSTAAGYGMAAGDSWVDQLDTWLGANTTNHSLVNLAFSGFTTNHIRENGSDPSVDPARNIDMAMTYSPDMILVNLPSNNVKNGILPVTTMQHYREIKAKADSAGVKMYFTTTQPREDLTTAERDLLTSEADSVRANFGAFVIDIYDELTELPSKDIKAIYNDGGPNDGIHLNLAGHTYIFGEVLATLEEQFTQFEVYRSLDDVTFELIASVPETDYVSQDLMPNTTYFYKVRTKDINGYSGYSDTASASTAIDNVAPTVPTGLTIITSTYTNVGMQWTASTDNVGVAKYYIYANSILIDSTTAITFSTNVLAPATFYSMTVSAVDASGNESAESTAATFTTDAAQIFYSKSTGDLTLVANWGTLADGSGTPPSNFDYNGQYFKITNRASATVSNNWVIGGNVSRVIVDDNTDLTISNALNGKIEVGQNSIISVNHDYEPEFLSIPSSSTIEFNTYSEIPTNTYGNVTLNGSGMKTLGSGDITVMGNLTIGTGVGLKGAPGNSTKLHLSGSLVQNGTTIAPSSDNAISLNFMGATHALTFAADFSFFDMTSTGSTVVSLATASPVTINLGSLNGGGLMLEAGSTLDIDDNTLRIRNAGTINTGNNTSNIASAMGSIELNSTSGLDSHLRMDAANNDISDFQINLTGTGISIVENEAEIFNALILENGSIDSQGNLTIKSDAGYNASIREITGSGQILGDVNVERYLDAKGKLYRYISTPVANTSIADWQASIPITGNFTGSSPQSSNPSIYYYDETDPSQWLTYPPELGDNSVELTKGLGYSVYLFNGASSQKIISTGNPYQGDVVYDGLLAPGTVSSSDGWTLIGNPYASDIFWNFADWTSADIGDVIYIRSNTTLPPPNNYTWETINRNTPGKIAAGQSFWVQTSSGAASLTLHETAKSSDAANANAPHFRTEEIEAYEDNQFTVHFEKEGLEFIDKAVIQFAQDGSDQFEKGKDGVKRFNSNINISTLSADDELLSFNLLKDEFCTKDIRLSIKTAEVGTFSIKFSNLSIFSLGSLALLDMEEETEHQITGDDFEYSFNISTSGTTLDDRFLVRVTRPTVELYTPTLASNEICALNNSIEFTLGGSQIGVYYHLKNKVTGESIYQISGTGSSLTEAVPLSAFEYGLNEFDVFASYSGCAEIKIGDNMSLEVFEDLIPTVDSDYITICENETVLTAGGGGTSYNWYDAQTKEFIENNDGNLVLKDLTGLNIYLVRAVNGLCESSKTQHINVLSTAPPKPLITNMDGLLLTDSLYVVQWYYNDEPIEGATEVGLTPTMSGNYTVKISNSTGCGTFSDPFEYLITGLDSSISDENLSVSVYPNPVRNGEFTVIGNAKSSNELSITIVDLFGRTVYIDKVEYNQFTGGIKINSGFSPGLYLLRVTQDGSTLDKKFLVK